jgi:hypothetical protein
MLRAATVLALAIVLITGLVLIYNAGGVREPRSATVTKPTPERVDRVEVQHVLVTAEQVKTAVQAPAAPQVRSSKRPPGARRAVGSPVLRSAMNVQKSPTLGGKTRRALLGDGRHKPQPFPRINNN